MIDCWAEISRLYVDSNIFIYFIEGNDQRQSKAQDIFQNFRVQGGGIWTAEITQIECLVGSIKSESKPIKESYEDLFIHSNQVHLVQLDQEVVNLSAHIAAHSGLKTVDAIHAATAIESGCDAILTNDRGFERLTKIKVLIFDDLKI